MKVIELREDALRLELLNALCIQKALDLKMLSLGIITGPTS